MSKPSARAACLLLAIAVCFLTAGCDRPVVDKSAQPSAIEALATRNVPRNFMIESQSRGREVFGHYCAICHGAEGKGDGFNSNNLAIPPRNFSDPEFWRLATDERLLLTISQGGPAVEKSVLMPAWGHTLTEHQLRDVIAFLHTLAPTAETQDKPAPDATKEP